LLEVLQQEQHLPVLQARCQLLTQGLLAALVHARGLGDGGQVQLGLTMRRWSATIVRASLLIEELRCPGLQKGMACHQRRICVGVPACTQHVVADGGDQALDASQLRATTAETIDWATPPVLCMTG
jgi:hypothetical protein